MHIKYRGAGVYVYSEEPDATKHKPENWVQSNNITHDVSSLFIASALCLSISKQAVSIPVRSPVNGKEFLFNLSLFMIIPGGSWDPLIIRLLIAGKRYLYFGELSLLGTRWPATRMLKIPWKVICVWVLWLRISSRECMRHVTHIHTHLWKVRVVQETLLLCT